MSRADDYLHAVAPANGRFSPDVVDLLEAIAEAWVEADSGFPSEHEAQRWSRVCSAAEKVVGL